MTCIALLNSDPVAKRWGLWALAAGPLVYFVCKWFAKRAAQKAR